ncbi:MAG: hypothetical protein Q4G33_14300 [bacterium]|nr:hypothetical protein [bacterium]
MNFKKFASGFLAAAMTITTMAAVANAEGEYFTSTTEGNQTTYKWDFTACDSTPSATESLSVNGATGIDGEDRGVYWSAKKLWSGGNWNDSISYTPTTDGTIKVTLGYGRDADPAIYILKDSYATADINTHKIEVNRNELVYTAALTAGSTYYVIANQPEDDSKWLCVSSVEYTVNSVDPVPVEPKVEKILPDTGEGEVKDAVGFKATVPASNATKTSVTWYVKKDNGSDAVTVNGNNTEITNVETVIGLLITGVPVDAAEKMSATVAVQ